MDGFKDGTLDAMLASDGSCRFEEMKDCRRVQFAAFLARASADF